MNTVHAMHLKRTKMPLSATSGFPLHFCELKHKGSLLRIQKLSKMCPKPTFVIGCPKSKFLILYTNLSFRCTKPDFWLTKAAQKCQKLIFTGFVHPKAGFGHPKTAFRHKTNNLLFCIQSQKLSKILFLACFIQLL